MEVPPAGLRTLPVLNDASWIKLGLFDAGPDGRPLIATNLTPHGLRRVPNPMNFNPITGLFMIDDEDRRLRGWTPCHPDEIAIPTYFVSYETLVFVGFTKIKAMELWESYKRENEVADAAVPVSNKVAMHQATFRLLRHGQRYLRANAKHATTFGQLQNVGFDNSTVYVGFQPSLRYRNGSPALDAVDPFQPPRTGTKLLAWALRTTFRRFVFLCQLNAMLDGAEERPTCATIRPSVFHWRSLISLFERNEYGGVYHPEDDDTSDSESDDEGSDTVETYTEKKDGVFRYGGASKVEKKGGHFHDGYTLEVIMEEEGISDEDTSEVIMEEDNLDENTSEAETPEPFPYYSSSASEVCDDNDLNMQHSEEAIVPENANDSDSDNPDPSLLALEKSLEKKVAEKKQEWSSVQSVGMTKTRDVDMAETVVWKDAETETKVPTAAMKTGTLDEGNEAKDGKRDGFKEPYTEIQLCI